MSAPSLFSNELVTLATTLIDDCRTRGLRLVTAESCTGGLLAGLLTEVPGASDVVERGYITYSNAAKVECLGVPLSLIESHGAVSRQVAEAMAEGAMKRAQVDLALAITGIAGPDGGTAHKPVGLVHIAAHRKGRLTRHHECRFGEIGRTAVRLASLHEALMMLESQVTKG